MSGSEQQKSQKDIRRDLLSGQFCAFVISVFLNNMLTQIAFGTCGIYRSLLMRTTYGKNNF